LNIAREIESKQSARSEEGREISRQEKNKFKVVK
jgi:hypothetical protein